MPVHIGGGSRTAASSANPPLHATIAVVTQRNDAPPQPPASWGYNGNQITGLTSAYIPFADIETLSGSAPKWILETSATSGNGGLTWTLDTPWIIRREETIEYAEDEDATSGHYPKTDTDLFFRFYHSDGTPSIWLPITSSPSTRLRLFFIDRLWPANSGAGQGHTVTLDPPLDLMDHTDYGQLELTWFSRSPSTGLPRYRATAVLLFNHWHLNNYIAPGRSFPLLGAKLGINHNELFWFTTAPPAVASDPETNATFTIQANLNPQNLIMSWLVIYRPNSNNDVDGNLTLEIT